MNPIERHQDGDVYLYTSAINEELAREIIEAGYRHPNISSLDEVLIYSSTSILRCRPSTKACWFVPPPPRYGRTAETPEEVRRLLGLRSFVTRTTITITPIQ